MLISPNWHSKSLIAYEKRIRKTTENIRVKTTDKTNQYH